MAPQQKGNRSNRIPISFLDSDKEAPLEAARAESPDSSVQDDEQEFVNDTSSDLDNPELEEINLDDDVVEASPQADGSPG